MSSVLDNLTTTIVMVSVLQKVRARAQLQAPAAWPACARPAAACPQCLRLCFGWAQQPAPAPPRAPRQVCEDDPETRRFLGALVVIAANAGVQGRGRRLR